MCQTAFISQSIITLGTRSYRHSLECLAPNEYSVSQLRRLNRDLNAFYENLHSQYNTITEHDYRVFGQQFTYMLHTLKNLYASCKRILKGSGANEEVDKLKKNYNALYELNNDIKNYRIKASNDAEWSTLLSDASLAMKKIASNV